MVNYILFVDVLRQEEIENFYKICQMHREYYRGYPKSYHPLKYFREPQYAGQCPPEMSDAILSKIVVIIDIDKFYTCDDFKLLAEAEWPVYLSYPSFHIKYKQPTVLPTSTDRTSGFPPLPDRSLAGRFNKAACRQFSR